MLLICGCSSIYLVTASEESLLIISCVEAPMQMADTFMMTYQFLIVDLSMAPAVFVRKKSGDIHLCVDYQELNKKTQKDTYPLPLLDEVQDKLATSEIFSTLDLQCGYWQMPVNPQDCHKTAFCPGPSMGLFHFMHMPFGLTGAPSSFQRLMN